MDRAFSLHRFIPFLALPSPHRRKLLDPGLVAIELDPSSSGDRLAQKFTAIGRNAKIDAPSAADFLGFDIHLDRARVSGDDAVTATGRQANTGTEQDDDV